MLQVTAVGRVGKDAEVRKTQNGNSVTSFSLAVNVGWGDRETTRWLDCSMWGQRGEKIAEYIRKGALLTVVGSMGQREYEGKTYDTLDVSDLALPPKSASDGGHAGQGAAAPQRQAPARAAAPPPPVPAGIDEEADIPF